MLKRGSNIQKTPTTQRGPTKADTTKAKHTTTDPANNSKVTITGTTTRDTSRGIKGNRTYRMSGKI